jgi:putative acetyltransferase
VLIRRETPADISAVSSLTLAAFGRPMEAQLLEWLRADVGWIPALSFVAISPLGGEVAGHVVCTRAWIGDAPALGLGPLSVHPSYQGRGVGTALMHTVLGAADALSESIVVLLGSTDYYSRFGFRPASALEIIGSDPGWGNHFQARPLAVYDGSPSGPFTYAEPFSRL